MSDVGYVLFAQCLRVPWTKLSQRPFSPIINVNNFKINSNIYILKRRSAPAIRHQGSPQACLLNGSAPRPETVQLPQ